MKRPVLTRVSGEGEGRSYRGEGGSLGQEFLGYDQGKKRRDKCGPGGKGPYGDRMSTASNIGVQRKAKMSGEMAPLERGN